MAITSINLGKIKFNWRGIWGTGTGYVKDDVVRHSGSSYVCVTGHTSQSTFIADASKWDLMAEGTTPTTTKGDLIYRDTANDDRLPIGDAGQVLTVEGGVPIWKDNGVNDKIYYVSPDGSDTNSGQSWGTAFATIRHACNTAVGPATVRVASGTYYEILPITVPSFVAVVGDNQRTTIVSPDSGYEQTTMWKMGDGSMLNKMCFIGLTGYIPYAPNDQNIELATIGGVYVAFDSTIPIVNKSPYIIECTAKSASGVGALLDGSLHASGIKSMVFHGYTVIVDSGIGYWVKDNAKSEIVSCFTYFAHVGYAATGGGKIRALNGNNSYGTYGVLASGYNAGESTLNGSLYGNQLEYTPVSLTGGSFTAGETITGSISGATGVIQNVQAGANKLYYKIATGGPFQVGETINNGAGVTAVIATGGVTGQKGFVLVVTGLSAEPKPGASIEFTSGDTFTYVIQSVSGWINSSSKTVIVLAGEKTVASLDGANIRIRYDYSNVRLTGHDFLSIGTGGVTTTNYPGAPLQPSAQGNEVIELFPARVFYVSTDQDGNFRVGEYFKVDQATGRATLNASAFDLSGLTSLKLGSIGAQLGELVNEFSSDDTLSGNSNTAVPTEKAVKQYFSKVSSNIVPSADDLYTLGTLSKRWNHLYVGDGSITIGTVTLSDNSGKLEVKVGASVAPTSINSINNGTSNVAVANDGNVTITSGGVLGLTINSSGDATFAGNVTINGGSTTLSSTEIKIEDAMLQMADQNPANVLDIGLFGHYTLATTLYHTGLVRDASDNVWKLFSGVTTNPSTTVDFTGATYDPLQMGALTTTGITSSGAIAVNSTSGITTDKTTFALVNATATTVNFAGAGTTIGVGATTGTLTINNPTVVGSQTTVNLWNTTSTTVNFAGAGTTVSIGAGTGSTTFNHDINIATGKKIKIAGSYGTDNKFLKTVSGGLEWADAAVTVSDITTNGTYYPLFTTATSGTVTTASVTSNATTIFSFNPSNGTLSAGRKLTLSGSSTGTVSFQAAASAGSTTYTLPSTDGTSGQSLTTNASGVLSWTTTGATISDDTSTTTLYPTMSTSTSGTLTTAKISSTKFAFNASTGALTTSGGFIESSSITLKENVTPITNALDVVLQLLGVTYDRKDGSRQNEPGLIAEDVDKIASNLVSHNADGRAEGIYYSKLTAYLVEAIKGLQSQIDPLKEEIRKLKGE